MRMIGDLFVHCVKRPSDFHVLRVIRAVRRAREQLSLGDAQGVSRELYARPARRLGLTVSEVEAVVETWMHERPLRYLPACRFPDVQLLFSDLRSSGRTIAVLSDYPAERKLAALGLAADLVVSSVDTTVDRFKPNPAGLRRILALTGAKPDECLLIGDRDELDGECARRLGVPFLLKTNSTTGPNRFARYAELRASL